ncbi:hypothetical protein KUCAC02_013705, partial [Chaenocephalus aceratus]
DSDLIFKRQHPGQHFSAREPSGPIGRGDQISKDNRGGRGGFKEPWTPFTPNERRSALAENYESEPAFASETGQEVRRGGGGGGGRNRKRADGGSVNEVNGKNGKGENQSREREEIRVAGLKIHLSFEEGALGSGSPHNALPHLLYTLFFWRLTGRESGIIDR